MQMGKRKMQVFDYQALAFCWVPGAGIEPARIAPLVFETSASTDSAIRAFGASQAVPQGTAYLYCALSTLLLADKVSTRSRAERERLEVDLPVKVAKVFVFSENPKFSYLCRI